MEGYVNKNKWIDLKVLPIKQWGNAKIIDWDKSINIPVNFTYNDIVGQIIILEHVNNDRIKVFVNGYTTSDGYIMYKSTYMKCQLGGALRKIVNIWAPETIQYLVNKNDACKYTIGNNAKVLARCPICGYMKEYPICQLVKYGFCCNRCGDGFSYPAKLMFSVLEQLNIAFIPELSKKIDNFQWLDQYRFDFYFEKDNCKYIIEMDGGFHYRERFKSLEKVKLIDKQKDTMAYKHGIHVIRINCNYDNINRFEYIKNNIINSELYSILDLNNNIIDWNLCNHFASSSLLKKTCDCWNEGIYSAQKIADVLKLSRSTVHKYLVAGGKIGLCDYTPEIASKIRNSNGGQSNRAKYSKHVAVYQNGLLIYVSFSIKELCRNSLKRFGRQFSKGSILNVCNNKQKQAYGYTMKFISDEEYAQCLQQLNPNNTKLI